MLRNLETLDDTNEDLVALYERTLIERGNRQVTKILAQAQKTAKKAGANSLQTATADGDATKASLDERKPLKFDLVATGKRSHEPLKQLHLGSVSRKFLCTHYVPWSR